MRFESSRHSFPISHGRVEQVVSSADCKSVAFGYVGSIPTSTTNLSGGAGMITVLIATQVFAGSSPVLRSNLYAQVAELADALGLGSSGEIRGGSNPSLGTNLWAIRIQVITPL